MQKYFSSTYTAYSFTKLIYLILISLGLCWGIPWINAAQHAAQLFPITALHTPLSYFYAIGIVITVGVDGVWIMLEVAKKIFANPPLKRPTKTHFFAFCFALLSCIAPVYAAFLFNNNKLLSLIILCVNFAFGFYGYDKLLNNLQQFFMLPRFNLSQCLRIITATIITIGAMIIEFYLTRQFLINFLSSISSWLIISMTLLMITPSAVVNFIATYHLSEKIWQFIARPQLFSSWQSSLSLLLALSAPSAACYITYTTLQEAQASLPVTYLAILMIALARFFFSNFTLNQVLNRF